MKDQNVRLRIRAQGVRLTIESSAGSRRLPPMSQASSEPTALQMATMRASMLRKVGAVLSASGPPAKLNGWPLIMTIVLAVFGAYSAGFVISILVTYAMTRMLTGGG